MKLYYFPTPNSRKVCAAAKYLGSKLEYVRVSLPDGEQRKPEFLAINPNGKVPVLVDGKASIWESRAIMCYLAEKAGSDFWPRDERAVDVIRWLCWDTAHFSRYTGTLVFENVIKPALGIGEPDAAAVKEALGHFRQFAAVLDGHLAGRKFIVGEQPSVVDFAVGGFLPDAEAAQIPLAEYPEVVRWYAELFELPAWRDPYPAASA